MQQRKEPLRLEARDVGGEGGKGKAATFIFIHGFGDDAEGVVNIAHQFQSANKLPHLTWVFPNAPHDHDSMSTAWYPPTTFSPIPIGSSSSSKPNEEEDEPVDSSEDAILNSVEYICGLIDEEAKNGVPLERIIVGGFSQGCALSLVLGLGSRYRGKLGGVVALSGYMPRGGKLSASYKNYPRAESKKQKVFLAHGTQDMLVPMRIYREAKKRIEGVVGEDALEAKTYEGMGHVFSGPELRDVCIFLEQAVPI